MKKELRCSTCGQSYPYTALLYQCACGGPLTYAISDGTFAVDTSRTDLWRYADLLPLRERRHIVSLGAGWSPIVELPEAAQPLGGARLFLKLDASGHPTGTFKDREASLIISRCCELGLDNLVFYSIPPIRVAPTCTTRRRPV